jgi:hypothetical protein
VYRFSRREDIMNFTIRPLVLAALVAALSGLHPAYAESPTIIMLNIDKYEIALSVVDNLQNGKTVYSGTLRSGIEAPAFKVATKPGGTDFTWTATGKNDAGAAVKRCGTVKDKNRGGRVDVVAGTTASGKTLGNPC